MCERISGLCGTWTGSVLVPLELSAAADPADHSILSLRQLPGARGPEGHQHRLVSAGSQEAGGHDDSSSGGRLDRKFQTEQVEELQTRPTQD